MPKLSLMYKPAEPRKNAAKTSGSSGGVQKRKKVVLSFVQREEVLELCKKGCSVEKIALDYGVAVRTVYDIRKAGDQKLLKYRSENPNSGIRSIFNIIYFVNWIS